MKTILRLCNGSGDMVMMRAVSAEITHDTTKLVLYATVFVADDDIQSLIENLKVTEEMRLKRISHANGETV